MLEKEANDTQSVNWIKIEKNKIIGTNFDGIGFTNGMKSNGFSISNKEFAIFGIGGAGSAICHSLLATQYLLFSGFIKGLITCT